MLKIQRKRLGTKDRVDVICKTRAGRHKTLKGALMQKKLFIGLSLFFALTLMTGPLAFADIPENNVIRSYFPNGKVRREERERYGQRTRLRTYNEAGKILSESRFKDGNIYYKRLSYPNGKIRSLWTKKSGVIKYYKPDGKIEYTVKTNGIGQ
jgi:antitoxin component YwqK of YwqJK toxin-antitoxin module